MCGHYCFAGFYFCETNNLFPTCIFYSILELKNILFVAVITQRQVNPYAGLGRFRRRLNATSFRLGVDKTSVCEFINILIADNYSVFYLLNYSRMYIDSKMITYAYLDYVSGVNRSLISSALHDEGRISHIFRYLAIIKDFEPVLGDIPASGGKQFILFVRQTADRLNSRVPRTRSSV
jgi:hypothetical protein